MASYLLPYIVVMFATVNYSPFVEFPIDFIMLLSSPLPPPQIPMSKMPLPPQ